MMGFVEIPSLDFNLNHLEKSLVDSYLIIVEFEWLLKQDIGFIFVAFFLFNKSSYVEENAIFSVEIALKSFD